MSIEEIMKELGVDMKDMTDPDPDMGEPDNTVVYGENGGIIYGD